MLEVPVAVDEPPMPACTYGANAPFCANAVPINSATTARNIEILLIAFLLVREDSLFIYYTTEFPKFLQPLRCKYRDRSCVAASDLARRCCQKLAGLGA